MFIGEEFNISFLLWQEIMCFPLLLLHKRHLLLDYIKPLALILTVHPDSQVGRRTVVMISGMLPANPPSSLTVVSQNSLHFLLISLI
ncbi:MAG: hypothetical protein QTN59_02120 [Candidatus Electrothrix communis]|jgi:hypothetical protein|nr:MAG: hypothetical protein QTN59_02120 [Candidatus Electrothrix communis]